MGRLTVAPPGVGCWHHRAWVWSHPVADFIGLREWHHAHAHPQAVSSERDTQLGASSRAGAPCALPGIGVRLRGSRRCPHGRRVVDHNDDRPDGDGRFGGVEPVRDGLDGGFRSIHRLLALRLRPQHGECLHDQGRHGGNDAALVRRARDGQVSGLAGAHHGGEARRRTRGQQAPPRRGRAQGHREASRSPTPESCSTCSIWRHTNSRVRTSSRRCSRSHPGTGTGTWCRRRTGSLLRDP